MSDGFDAELYDPSRQRPSIWTGTVVVEPNVRPSAHNLRTRNCRFIVKGRARFRLGDHLEFVAEAGPGNFIYEPPFVPHQE
jgi:uncharacterized RmlC-like cupin family protein